MKHKVLRAIFQGGVAIGVVGFIITASMFLGRMNVPTLLYLVLFSAGILGGVLGIAAMVALTITGRDENMPRRKRVAALLVVGIMLSLGNSYLTFRHVFPFHPDAWATRLPSWAFQSSTQLAKNRLFPVTNEFLSEAIARPETQPLIPLSMDDAGRLTSGQFSGEKYKDSKYQLPVLLRGLYLIRGTGAFTVRLSGSEAWVIHSSLGSPPRPKEQRHPVVAILETLPTR